MKHQAVELAEMGYHLVPWHNRLSDKPRPLITSWISAHIPSVETVIGWAERYPKADWAILHKDSVVLDLEMKNGLNGVEDLSRIQSDKGVSLIAHTKVSTKTNGFHMWFKKPAGSPNRSGRIADGIEVKCCNAGAHCPPSMGYGWLIPPVKPEYLEELPQAIVDMWTVSSSAVSVDYDRPQYCEGERRTMLCAMAKAMRNIGLRENELIAALASVNIERCSPAYPEQDVIAIAKDYSKREVRDPVSAALAGNEQAKAVCSLMKGMGAWL